MSVSVSKHVGRLANRAKRQAIASVPPVRRMARYRHDRRVRRYASRLPPLSAEDAAVVSRLRADAIHVTTLGELALPGTAELCEGLERLATALASRPPLPGGTVRPSMDELVADPRVWQFGLSERMLAIAENYLGMPARYYGADVRREIADGEAHDVRQWHRDIEDRSTLKILVWLNDVDEDGGPFAYIPVDRSQEVVDRLHYVAGFVSDARMRQVEPEQEWRTCPGPRWTAVMADNCRLVHRATPPRARDRYSVTFTWTSRHPVKTMPQAPMTDAQARRASAGLTARQLACLPPALQKQARR
ncbi:hypothetical protein [Georgenia sp. SYP-B2076]|uniref:hypothetical protein n=1 Tax=Georgenia sp. SYP-B2076 TaxID=2495881 RepID=UPI000F8C7B4C|nr:hypothetical protein [Georgenia sp. SYP-B2076]